MDTKHAQDVSNKHMKGYFYLFITIVLYVISPFLVKETYINKDTHYKKPFFIVYFSTCCNLLFGIPLIFRFCSKTATSVTNKPYALSNNRVMYISLVIGSLTLFQNYLYNAAVEYTAVSSNFILHDTSDAFVFIFCIIFLGWSFSWIRFFSICISIVGILLIGYSDSHDSKQPSSLFGDLLSLTSTVIYGLLGALTKMYIEEEDSIDWIKFLFYTGFTCGLAWLPILALFHYTEIEKFEIPNLRTLELLLANGIIAYALSNYTFSYATVLLDPLLVDVGLGILAPVAMVVDYYYEGKEFDFIYIVGYGFVTAAFIILMIYDYFFEIQEQVKTAELVKAKKETSNPKIENIKVLKLSNKQNKMKEKSDEDEEKSLVNDYD